MGINLSKVKTPITLQNLNERVKNFDEVSLGYTKEEAVLEANRCLNCKKPSCMSGCPAHIHIPLFIEKIRDGEIEEAYKVIKMSSNLSSVCSRVCNQDIQCEGHCVRGRNGEPVAIGKLERYVNDNVDLSKISAESKHLTQKVSIIGAGPAGISCADELNSLGFDVTVYDKNDEAGGVLRYGIPDFRLPRNILDKIIKRLKDNGVKFIFNKTFGIDFNLNTLKSLGFDAVFFGTGADESKTMNLPGEDLEGVYKSNDFLRRAKFDKESLKNLGNVIVIGGGNVAMDVSRTAIRLKAKTVSIVYRRTMDEMPARKDEINETIEEGVNINILTNPIKINGDTKVESIECVKMKLGEPDSSGRRRPLEINDSNFNIKADTIIYAIGSETSNLVRNNVDAKIINDSGLFIVNEETFETNIENIYAGGDSVSGPKTVVAANRAGKDAAKAIYNKLVK